MKTTWTVLLLVAGGLLAAADPFKVTPPWEVRVTDTNGQALANCTIVQEWGYNLGNLATNATAKVTTNQKGVAHLPERWIRSPVEKSPLRKVVEQLSVQPGVGPWANLYVWKPGYAGQFIYLKRDSRVLYTTNGVVSTVALEPAPAR